MYLLHLTYFVGVYDSYILAYLNTVDYVVWSGAKKNSTRQRLVKNNIVEIKALSTARAHNWLIWWYGIK